MYAERPDFFAAMATGDTELERMLAVLRWTCESNSWRREMGGADVRFVDSYEGSEVC